MFGFGEKRGCENDFMLVHKLTIKKHFAMNTGIQIHKSRKFKDQENPWRARSD